jgi:hypothetical protein
MTTPASRAENLRHDSADSDDGDVDADDTPGSFGNGEISRDRKTRSTR